MAKTHLGVLTLLALSTVLIQGGGRTPGSALQYRERRPLPPQVVDLAPYDDIIELKTERLPSYLDFDGSKLSPTIRVRSSYRTDTNKGKASSDIKFEDIWYANGKPVGLKRFNRLAIKQYDRVGVFVSAKSGSMTEPEAIALANALVRVRLETSMNRNLLVTVRVPNEKLELLKAELEKQNFTPYGRTDRPSKALIALPLETEVGRREVMCFKGHNQ